MLIRLVLPSVCVVLIAGCCLTRPAADAMQGSSLDVSVFYRERIMLQPGSQLEVTLADVSKMDVPAQVISTATHDIATGPPYNVTLSYNEDQILPKHRYSLKARISSGGRLMFISTSTRDPFISDKRPVEIMVERVATKQAKPDSPLENTRWRLIRAKGKTITLEEGQKERYMLLEMNSDRVRGFSGCNNFTGTYKVDGSTLSFSQVAATMKMCIKGMEDEQLFHTVINETAAYEVTGENLKLIDAHGEELAVFKAIYLQ